MSGALWPFHLVGSPVILETPGDFSTQLNCAFVLSLYLIISNIDNIGFSLSTNIPDYDLGVVKFTFQPLVRLKVAQDSHLEDLAPAFYRSGESDGADVQGCQCLTTLLMLCSGRGAFSETETGLPRFGTRADSMSAGRRRHLTLSVRKVVNVCLATTFSSQSRGCSDCHACFSQLASSAAGLLRLSRKVVVDV